MKFIESIQQKSQGLKYLNKGTLSSLNELCKVLFPDIESINDLPSVHLGFLQEFSKKYVSNFKNEILVRVENEVYEFYEHEEKIKGIKINDMYLDKLKSGKWQLLFEEEFEDPIVHVHFLDWEIQYTTITG